MKYHIYILIIITTVISCTQPPNNENIKNRDLEISTKDILDHIKYLSADERHGRFPGTKGSKETIKYIIDDFKNVGIQPAGIDGYTQPFDFTTGIQLVGVNRFIKLKKIIHP